MKKELFVSVCEFIVRPEDHEAFTRHTMANATQSRATEPGCIQYDVLVPNDGRPSVVLYEIWRDEQAFIDHHDTPHLKQWLSDAAPMVLEQKPMQLARVASAT